MFEGKELVDSDGTVGVAVVKNLLRQRCCSTGMKLKMGLKLENKFLETTQLSDRFTQPALTPRMIHSTKSTKCQCHVLRSGKPQATASVFEATGHSFTPVTVSTTTSSNNLLLPFCKAPVGIVSKKRHSTITMHLYAFIKYQGNMLLCQLSFTILHL